MQKTRMRSVWIVVFAMLLLSFFVFSAPTVSATTIDSTENLAEETTPTNTPLPASEDPENPDPEATAPEDPDPEGGDVDEPVTKQGLVEENGALYYYNDDGSLFTGKRCETIVTIFTF